MVEEYDADLLEPTKINRPRIVRENFITEPSTARLLTRKRKLYLTLVSILLRRTAHNRVRIVRTPLRLILVPYCHLHPPCHHLRY